MSRRVERRFMRVGTMGGSDPESLEELEERRARHERMMRKGDGRSFQQVLQEQQPSKEEEKTENEESIPAPSARHPAHPPGKVIIKG